MVGQFIDDHRDRFGVEPICRVLTEHAVPIAPSGYYAFKKRPASARAVADAELIGQIERVFWDRKLGRGISEPSATATTVSLFLPDLARMG